MTHALSATSLDPRKVANMAVTEGVNLKYVETMRRSLYAAAGELDRLTAALAQIAETSRWYADNGARDPHEVDHALCVEVVSIAERALEEPLANGGTQ